MKVALCDDDGRCDTAFSGGNCCVESGWCDHQQIAAAFVTRRVRIVSLRGIIYTKNMRIFRHIRLLLFQEGCSRFRMIRNRVLIIQMRLALDAHVVLHPIAILTLLPFQNIAQQSYVSSRQKFIAVASIQWIENCIINFIFCQYCVIKYLCFS